MSQSLATVDPESAVLLFLLSILISSSPSMRYDFFRGFSKVFQSFTRELIEQRFVVDFVPTETVFNKSFKTLCFSN